SMQPVSGVSNFPTTFETHAGSIAMFLVSAVLWHLRSPPALLFAHLTFAALHLNGVGGPEACAPIAPSRSAAADSVAAPSIANLFIPCPPSLFFCLLVWWIDVVTTETCKPRERRPSSMFFEILHWPET